MSVNKSNKRRKIEHRGVSINENEVGGSGVVTRLADICVHPRNCLLRLPDIVLKQIVSSMALRERAALLKVCKKMNWIVNESWDSVNPSLCLVSVGPWSLPVSRVGHHTFISDFSAQADCKAKGPNYDLLKVTKLISGCSVQSQLLPRIGKHLLNLQLDDSVLCGTHGEVFAHCSNLRSVECVLSRGLDLYQLSNALELESVALNISQCYDCTAVAYLFSRLQQLKKVSLICNQAHTIWRSLATTNITHVSFVNSHSVYPTASDASELIQFIQACNNLQQFIIYEAYFNTQRIIHALGFHCRKIELIDIGLINVDFIPEEFIGNRICLKLLKLRILCGLPTVDEGFYYGVLPADAHPLIRSLPPGVVVIHVGVED